MRFLTPVEIARLADTIRPHYRALVLVGAYGGLRIGELAGLRRERCSPAASGSATMWARV
jgi:integrase